MSRGLARRRGGPQIFWEAGGREGGRPLLLIRGLGRSSSYWLDFRERLEAERWVVVMDNRGVGRSESPDRGWWTEEMADDAAEVLRASGVERADVFGISLGGMIAQQLALRHPHRVARLALGCTTFGGRRAVRVPPRAALALARAIARPFDESIRRTAPWVLGPETLARRPDIVETWVQIAASEPRSRRGVAGQLLAAARHATYDLLPHLRAPTLVVSGDADRLIPPENSPRLAARIPGARLAWLRGAPHDFPTERPEETARTLLAFLG